MQIQYSKLQQPFTVASSMLVHCFWNRMDRKLLSWIFVMQMAVTSRSICCSTQVTATSERGWRTRWYRKARWCGLLVKGKQRGSSTTISRDARVSHRETPSWLQIPTPILLHLYGSLASGFLLVTEKIDEKA